MHFTSSLRSSTSASTVGLQVPRSVAATSSAVIRLSRSSLAWARRRDSRSEKANSRETTRVSSAASRAARLRSWLEKRRSHFSSCSSKRRLSSSRTSFRLGSIAPWARRSLALQTYTILLLYYPTTTIWARTPWDWPNSPLGPWRRRSATAVAASSRVDADSGRRVRGVADRSPKKLHEKNITTKHRRTLRGRPRSPPSPAPHPRAPSTRRTSTPTSPPHQRCHLLRVPPRHHRGGSLHSHYHCANHDEPSVKVVVRVRPTVSRPVHGKDLWFVRRTAPDSVVAVRCGWRPRRQGLSGRCVRSGGIVHDRELAELTVLN